MVIGAKRMMRGIVHGNHALKVHTVCAVCVQTEYMYRGVHNDNWFSMHCTFTNPKKYIQNY